MLIFERDVLPRNKHSDLLFLKTPNTMERTVFPPRSCWEKNYAQAPTSLLYQRPLWFLQGRRTHQRWETSTSGSSCGSPKKWRTKAPATSSLSSQDISGTGTAVTSESPQPASEMTSHPLEVIMRSPLIQRRLWSSKVRHRLAGVWDIKKKLPSCSVRLCSTQTLPQHGRLQ